MNSLLDAIPLWALFVTTLVGMLVCAEAGYRIGGLRRAAQNKEPESPVGSVVGAALGLLWLLMAITFSLAATRFEDRRGAVLDEANAIGTCYLRAGMLPDAQHKEVRRLLKEYVDLRVAGVSSGSIAAAIARSGTIQNQLWAQATTAAQADPKSIQIGLFVESLNDVIDLHGKRLHASFYSRLPGTVWVVLLSVGALSFLMMGYHGGLAGNARSPAMVVVALAFACVLWLVVDLERPLDGTLVVSQQPMIDLRSSMDSVGP
jgi:hypothetical protein